MTNKTPQSVKMAIESLKYIQERTEHLSSIHPDYFGIILTALQSLDEKGEELPLTLPCDVTIGAGNFMRGTPTKNVINKLKWWSKALTEGKEAPKNRTHCPVHTFCYESEAGKADYDCACITPPATRAADKAAMKGE